MAGLPEITITGTTVAEPELRFTAHGTAVANVTVACNDRRFDKTTGQWTGRGATFLRCTCWKHTAENIAESLPKATRVPHLVRSRRDDIGASLRWASTTVHKHDRATSSTTITTADPWTTAPPATTGTGDTPPF